jgi:hypothetical protein
MYKATKTLLAENVRLLIGSCVAYGLLWHALVRSQPVNAWSSGVVAWWTTLCAVSVVNLCGWRLSAATLVRQKTAVEPAVYYSQRRQLVLSAVYVLGCCFRSILPRADVQRISLVDSWTSSVMVGRSVATVAELCFVIQWALLLHATARDARSRLGVGVSWLLVPLIVVAEVCSWYAVLTTNYLGNAIEESLWTLSAALLVLGCVTLWFQGRAGQRPLLAAAIVLGITYVAFMSTVDVPNYVSRWLSDEAHGRAYLSLDQGLRDAWTRRCVTFDWDEWRPEVPWMSLYFSVAVWCSIALVQAPRLAWQPRFELGERNAR